MAFILNLISDYMNNHIALLLFLCLGCGYVLGKLKIKSFTLGSTVGTLVVGILFSQFVDIEIQSTLKTVFFSLFCFTIGFDVGPKFFSSLKSSGIKLIVLSVFFTTIALTTTYLLCLFFKLDVGYGIGLLGGAITQSSVTGAAKLAEDMSKHATVAFGLTYVFGTLGVVFFVKNIAPIILRKNLKTIVKSKIDGMSVTSSGKETETVNNIVQIRAFVINPDSRFCGLTVEQFEDIFFNRLEVEALYRGNEILSYTQHRTLLAGDVVQTIGDISILDNADTTGLTEVSDPKYFKVEVISAKIVLTDDFTENGYDILSGYGILVKPSHKNKALTKNTIISVKGSEKAIAKAAKIMGYIKDESDVTDIAFVAAAISVGLFIGSLALNLASLSLSLGSSVGVLLTGLVCGWWYNKHPRVGYIPKATGVFLKGLGLNFYIAALSLEVGTEFFSALGSNGLLLLGLGAVITLVPHILSLLFGKYILRIDEADLLGGLCGCGTCTAALNGLTDETGSSVFALGYAPGCAAGNILLTIAGLLLPFLM
ncbi:MAG: hypothetical protein IJ285_06695 [Clostridia bacterium]|nr:hypothetical protein [Clostridia bacterium]